MCAYIRAYIGAWEHMRPPKGEHIAYHICQFEEHILARPKNSDTMINDGFAAFSIALAQARNDDDDTLPKPDGRG
jgi:hypothetical protein